MHVNINIPIYTNPECFDIPSHWEELLIWIKLVVLSKHHPEKWRLNYRIP